jgi:hypothetical protein
MFPFSALEAGYCPSHSVTSHNSQIAHIVKAMCSFFADALPTDIVESCRGAGTGLLVEDRQRLWKIDQAEA